MNHAQSMPEFQERFPVAEWETRQEEKGVAYKGTPGTWLDLRKVKGRPHGWIALVCCPLCAIVFALHKRVHAITEKGKVSPVVRCTRTGCSYHAEVTLEGWNKKPLWGVAIERTMPDGTLKAEMHHTHALTEQEARWHCAGLGGTYRIVSVAPAIGFLEGGN